MLAGYAVRHDVPISGEFAFSGLRQRSWFSCSWVSRGTPLVGPRPRPTTGGMGIRPSERQRSRVRPDERGARRTVASARPKRNAAPRSGLRAINSSLRVPYRAADGATWLRLAGSNYWLREDYLRPCADKERLRAAVEECPRRDDPVALPRCRARRDQGTQWRPVRRRAESDGDSAGITVPVSPLRFVERVFVYCGPMAAAQRRGSRERAASGRHDPGPSPATYDRTTMGVAEPQWRP